MLRWLGFIPLSPLLLQRQRNSAINVPVASLQKVLVLTDIPFGCWRYLFCAMGSS